MFCWRFYCVCFCWVILCVFCSLECSCPFFMLLAGLEILVLAIFKINWYIYNHGEFKPECKIWKVFWKRFVYWAAETVAQLNRFLLPRFHSLRWTILPSPLPLLFRDFKNKKSTSCIQPHWTILGQFLSSEKFFFATRFKLSKKIPQKKTKK